MISSALLRKGEWKNIFNMYLFIVLSAGGHLLELVLESVTCSCGRPISCAGSSFLMVPDAFGSGGGFVFSLNVPTVASQ